MKLHIDNIDGFNAIFETSFIPSESSLYEVKIAELKDVINEKHFWEICTFECRRMLVNKAEEAQDGE